MPGIIVSSTTDTPEQVQEALALAGYGQESVEIIQTRAEDAKPGTPAAEPPASTKPAGSGDKSAAAPGATETHQEPEPGTTEDKDKPKPGEVPPAVQKRIDKAVAKQRDAERATEEERQRRETLERELADLKAAKPAPAKTELEPPASDAAAATDDAEPLLDAFEDYEGWVKAHQKWTARQENAPLRAEIDALKAKLQAKDETDAAQRERQPLVDAWLDSVEKARSAHPDYDQVVEASEERKLVATPAMHQEIFESGQKAEIVYYLASHPEECQRIAELTAVPEKPTPDQVGKAIRIAAREIGIIEARLGEASSDLAPVKAPETPKPKPSAAPAPIKTVGSKSSAGTKDPGTMSAADYAEWRTAHPNG